MNYFEVKQRLEKILEFRALYREYIDFTNRENNVPAQMTRKKMEPLTAITVDSLNQVELGSMITRDAPVKGGKKVKINLIRAIFRDQLIHHFSLLWRQKAQLFNPLFWLYHFVGYLAWLPLLILKKAGYDTSDAEKLAVVKLYVIVFQLAVFYLLLEWSGTIALIRFDILGL